MADEAVDELDVELARLSARQERGAARGSRLRPSGRTGSAARRASCLERRRNRRRRRRATASVAAAEDAMRREDLEPRVGGADEHDHHARALRRPLLVRVGERRLVAVVAVRDQELPAGEELGDPVAREHARDACPSASRSGSRSGRCERRLAVVEEEDRLELRPRRAEQPQPALLRARVRPLVREHGLGLVRLDPQRGDEPAARPRDPVRADVVLRDRPDGRLRRRGRASLREPARKSRPASSSESLSVRWTTLCGSRAQERVALLRREMTS